MRRNLVKEVLPEYLQKALYDQKFAPNSVKVVKGNNSYDVVMLVNRTKPEYRQANISTIYLDARESDSDTLTTDKMAVCKNFADNLLKDFVNNTDKSIKKFHEYNSKYADDKNNQGDYDNVSKEDSTVQIADWVFEGNRKYGDVKVLPSTYGYTIVYFKEYGEVDYYQKAKKLAKDDLYDQKLNKLKKDVKVVLE